MQKDQEVDYKAVLVNLKHTREIALQQISQHVSSTEQQVLYETLLSRSLNVENELVKMHDSADSPLNPAEIIDGLKAVEFALKHLTNAKQSKLAEVEAKLAQFNNQTLSVDDETSPRFYSWRQFYIAAGVIVLLAAIAAATFFSLGTAPIVLGAVLALVHVAAPAVFGLSSITAIPAFAGLPSMSVLSLASNIIGGLGLEKAMEWSYLKWTDRVFNRELESLETTLNEIKPEELEINPDLETLVKSARDAATTAEVLRGMQGSASAQIMKGIRSSASDGLADGLRLINAALKNRDDPEKAEAALTNLHDFKVPGGWFAEIKQNIKSAAQEPLLVRLPLLFMGLCATTVGAVLTLVNPVFIMTQAEGTAVGLVAGRVRDAKLEAVDPAMNMAARMVKKLYVQLAGATKPDGYVPPLDEDERKQALQSEIKPSRASALEALKTADATQEFKQKFSELIRNSRKNKINKPLAPVDDMTNNNDQSANYRP